MLFYFFQSAEKIYHNDKDIREIKKTEEEITEYFILLHGKLTLIEHKLRKELSSVNTRKNLEDILKQLTGYIEVCFKTFFINICVYE